MRTKVAAARLETPGLDFETSCQSESELARAGKNAALECLAAAIDGQPEPRKVLASECGMSESNFSKIARGGQGDLLGLLYLLPSPIRKDFVRRLAETEETDPVELAAEQLTVAALRFLRLRGIAVQTQPVKAELRAQAAAHCA